MDVRLHAPLVVLLRPLKQIKTKVTFAISVMGGQIEISIFAVTNACQ
jgi:hypothetical protein